MNNLYITNKNHNFRNGEKIIQNIQARKKTHKQMTNSKRIIAQNCAVTLNINTIYKFI